LARKKIHAPSRREASLQMQARMLTVAAFALALSGGAAHAQIIATSIPKSVAGGGEGRWAFHLMWAPYAKWNIATFEEDPTAFLATKGDPKSDFLGAAEVAFKAGDNASIGLGGWYNKVGNDSAEYVFLLADPDGTVLLSGPLNRDVKHSEGHVNLFYKSLGVQFGLVHTSTLVNTITADIATVNGEPFPLDLANALLTDVAGVEDTANDYDGYLVYKTGGISASDTHWSFSLGGGFYHYDIVSKTVPSFFATATVGLFKGLGVDASYWYVAKTKRSELQDALSDLGVDLDQNLNRFMVGVSYTFSQ
jgi:hypothetical protein